MKKQVTYGLIFLSVALGGVFSYSALVNKDESQIISLQPSTTSEAFSLYADSKSQTKSIRVAKNTESIKIDITHDKNVNISIFMPTGKILDDHQLEKIGAERSSQSNDKYIREVVIIPNPRAGEWKVTGKLEQEGKGQVLLDYTAVGGDQLRAGLEVDLTQIEDRPFPIAVAVFEGNKPVKNAKVLLNIMSGEKKYATFEAFDNGNKQNGDGKVGDGLYVAKVSGLEPRAYRIESDITVDGQSVSSGIDIFRVEPTTARMRASFTDEAIDTNGDGFKDTIKITYPMEFVKKAGLYSFRTSLLSKSGNGVSADIAGSTLDENSKEASVYFSLESLREYLKEDGPYQIESVKFLWSPLELDAKPQIHLIQDLENLGQTKAYKLDEMDGPILRNAKIVSDRGIDTNGNGQFDQIEVTFQVDCKMDNLKLSSYGASLVPSREFSDDVRFPTEDVYNVTLNKGINNLKLVFNVGEYGLNEIEGPYSLMAPNFEASNLNEALMQKGYDELYDIPYTFGKTKPYSASQLENGPRISISSLIEYVQGMNINKPGNAANAQRNKLLKRLRKAESKQAAGNTSGALAKMDTFINQLNAQAGKAFSNADVQKLHEMVAELRKIWQP